MPPIPRANSSDTTELYMIDRCNELYVQKGTVKTIPEYFHSLFGAKMVILGSTSTDDVFTLKYLVVESARYPDAFHFLVGQDLHWVVKERLQLDPKNVRRRLDDMYKETSLPDSTLHDYECQVSVFLMGYFEFMLNQMVKACSPDSPMVTNLRGWIRCLTRVSDAVSKRHGSRETCKFKNHQHRFSEAFGRVQDVIHKADIKHRTTDPSRAMVIFEHSSHFDEHDHLKMSW